MLHEIAIIGGGPSGSTAAIYLADYGFDVCLIEKKVFPRETLCGEFLSREVIQNLEELNLIDDFLNLNPNSINSFKLIDDNDKEIFAQLDFQAYGLKRSEFDNLLLTKAQSKGVTIYQPCEVSEIIKENGTYRLSLKSSEQLLEKISSHYVIAAYGKRNQSRFKAEKEFHFLQIQS